MSDEALLRRREALERKKARLLEELTATEREETKIAQLQALAEELKYDLVPKPAEPATAPLDSPLTIEMLAELYRTDKRSPYQEVRPASRKQYDKMIRQVVKRCGNAKVADLEAPKLQGFYDEYANAGKISMGHGVITQLRGLARFGMTELRDTDCEKLAFILHGMHFQNVESRKAKPLSPEQVAAIIAKAHELGFHSLALAQALQFHLGMKQADVIGQWVPLADSVYSEIIYKNQKWARGLRWNQINDDWILEYIPSSGGDAVQWRLTDYPAVMAEIKDALRRLDSRSKSGPVIIDERSGRPYHENQFRLDWRKAADAVGIPKTVYNKDSRPTNEREAPANRRNFKR
jgi:hypothetical protein